MLVVMNTGHTTRRILNGDDSPAGGREFKEGQRGANNRVEHLSKAESEKIRRKKTNQRTASCRCFELLSEHNTSIKIDPTLFINVADNDKRPYAQRNLMAFLLSPLSRLPSLQCFSANVPEICITCCMTVTRTKNVNPVLDAASI